MVIAGIYVYLVLIISLTLVFGYLWYTWYLVTSGISGNWLPVVYLVFGDLWYIWYMVSAGLSGIWLPQIYLVFDYL